MKKKTTTRIDSGAPERGPLAIEKDGLGELLAERALQTATSGDEPAEYNEDDAADLADTDPGIIDADEDDFEPPQRSH
jgi:hypothetical protein